MNLEKWLNHFDEFEAFVESSGRRPSHDDKVLDKERRIGYWLKDQKKNYKNGKLDPKLYEMIENVLSDTKTKNDLSWETTYEELNYFLRDHQGTPPKRYKNEQETHLAYWLKDQRKYLDKENLSEERINKLDLLKEKYEFDWRIKARNNQETNNSDTRKFDLDEMLNDSPNITKSTKTK